MVNLIIDIGNTRTKIALFNQGELMISFPVNKFSVDDLDIILCDYPGIERAILSTVKSNQEDLLGALKSRIPFFVELTHHTPLPIENSYETPETLGKDRIAAAAGANKLFPDQHILVIDAGTAITYEFVTKKGVYTGGFITPGLRMRFKSLNHFTDKLPLLEPDTPTITEGTNTVKSIRGGIQYGLEGEITQIIKHFSEIHGAFQIILTGGDAEYIQKLTHIGLVNSEITLIGLNSILEYSFSQKAN
jgi:type III pantothenate kinase